MPDDPVKISSRPLLGLLLRAKTRALWNRSRQAVNDAPLRISTAVVLIATIWMGLYFLFHAIFAQLQRTPLEATVAIPLVFNFFFIVMLTLLTFSNALIAYSALFEKDESAYLLTAPLTPLDVVTLKYLESLVLASWSLVVLGIPMMLAMAELADQRIFYVLFLAFFLAFIPIPGALGLLIAWVAARFVPRGVARDLAIALGVFLTVFVLWGMRTLQLGDSATEQWLMSFYARMSFIESAFLPNNWVATGIDHAIHNNFAEALLYLGVTLANAFFLSWLAVHVVSRYFHKALDRVSAGRGADQYQAGRASGGAAGLLFVYLPLRLRLIAAKDLRTFLRDPLQWSQLAILFGLLFLYLTNMPTLRQQFDALLVWAEIIPFLNLCAISLILATFTCRFVYPLISLEGHNLWLIGLLPMSRTRILRAKLAFAMTVTLTGAITAMALAAFKLQLDWVWTIIHLVVVGAICFGLCGFAVGIGARLPLFEEQKVARIANSLGGTTNLLASLALVAVVLTAIGFAIWRSKIQRGDGVPDTVTLAICAAAVWFSIEAGLSAMRMGAKHFEQIEV